MGTAPFVACMSPADGRRCRVSHPVGQEGLGPLDHVVGGEPELLHDDRARGRGAEVVDADGVVGVAVPAEGGAGLDAQHRHPGREDRGPVVRRPAARSGPSTGTTPPGPARPRRPASWRRPRSAGPRCPVPTRTISGAPVAVDQDVGAPRPRPSAARSAVAASTGTFWRVRTRPTGPSASTARRQACAVSLASAGRTRLSPGMARREARCSIGWCVGPSSPRPMESWVHE